MEGILHSYFTWGDFLQTILMLTALYFVLHFLNRILPKALVLGRFQQVIQNVTRRVLSLFELIALLILGSTFVLIQPAFHGALVLLLITGGFSHIKDYISGQLVRFNPAISVGKELKSPRQQGVITDIGRLGLQITTDEGLQFINYSRLIGEDGLSLSGDEVGGFYQLKVVAKQEQTLQVSLIHFADRLADAPYLDWNHKVEVHPSIDQSGGLEAKILVKEEGHLYDLIKLIDEWGYTCEILHK